jgi:GT2 family glycosyltransferase
MDQVQGEQPLELLATVIIVSFHHGAALRRCLDAVSRSTERQRLQVIVLDIGSYDTTSTYDLDFPEVTFLRMPRNFGASKAMNIGIRSAKAELLFFLDPGIEVQADTIARLAAALEEIPDAGSATPVFVNASGQPAGQLRRLPDADLLWKLWQDEGVLAATPVPATTDPVPNEYPGRQALLVRRSFLKGMNYFDEAYGEWGGDLELAFQIRHAGKRAYAIPGATAVDHRETDRRPMWTPGQRATLAADRLNGVSHFISKRRGFFPALGLRVKAILTTLLRGVTFQDGGYNWPLLGSLLGGEKVDGSQGSL